MEMDYLKRLVQGINFIESKLMRNLELNEIASAACLSPYHFHRIFTALTGESPGEYIRSRRLSAASILLAESDKRILDIALEAGYESQEAFTRAFKKNFRETPNRFRKKGYTSHFLRRDALTEDAIQHLIRGVTMEPRIISRKSLLLCGVEGKTSKNNNRVGGIWQKLLGLVQTIPGRLQPDTMYGIGEYMDPATFTDDTDFHYFAGTEVAADTKIPGDLTIKTIPEGRWAVFTHKGGVETLPKTFDYIYGPWALKGSETILEADDMEYYDSRFKPQDPSKSEIDIYIPIQ